MKKIITSLALALALLGAQASSPITLVPDGMIVNNLWAANCYSGTCSRVPNSEPGSTIDVKYALPSPWSATGGVDVVYNGQTYSAKFTDASKYTLIPFTNGQYIVFTDLVLTHVSGATITLNLSIYDHFAKCGGRGSAYSCNAQHVKSGSITY
jgi:hypothetical protein